LRNGMMQGEAAQPKKRGPIISAAFGRHVAAAAETSNPIARAACIISGKPN